MTTKSMTTDQQLLLAQSTVRQRDADRDRKLRRWLRTGEAIRRSCGHIVVRDHGYDDEPDGPYYDDCGCPDEFARFAFADMPRDQKLALAHAAIEHFSDEQLDELILNNPPS